MQAFPLATIDPRRRALIAAALASAAPPALAQSEPPSPDVAALAGRWAGELEHRGLRTPIAVEIAPSRTGVLVAKLSLPAMNLYDAALDKARFENGQLHFASFVFDYDRTTDRLHGTLPKDFVPVYALKTTLARTQTRLQSTRGELDAPTREPLWRVEVGAPAWSDLATAQGTVFVGTDDGTLHALDARTGASRWRFRADGPLRSGITVSGERLFVTSDDGVLHCLAVQDAKPHWQVRVNRAAAVRLPASDPQSKFDFHGAAVHVAGDTLFAGTHEGRVLALDARDGRARWSFSTGDRIVAAPGLAGGTLYAGSFDGKVHALDAAGGALRWTFDARAPVTSTPARIGDVVIVGSRAYDLWGLDAAAGRERWNRYVWFSWIESSPVWVGRTAYVGSSDAAKVFAFDAVTGASRWTTDVHGLAWGTPALDGDQLIVATRGESGPLGHKGHVLALDRATGAVRWRHALRARDSDATYGVAGSARVTEGRAFVATVDGEVLAFATR